LNSDITKNLFSCYKLCFVFSNSGNFGKRVEYASQDRLLHPTSGINYNSIKVIQISNGILKLHVWLYCTKAPGTARILRVDASLCLFSLNSACSRLRVLAKAMVEAERRDVSRCHLICFEMTTDNCYYKQEVFSDIIQQT